MIFFGIDIDERDLGEAIERDLAESAEKIIARTVKLTPREIRRLMQNSPATTGRKYRRTGGNGFQRFHAASSPGNPIRDDTGAFSRSLQARVTGNLTGEIEMLWYGEFHDRNGRPFLEKAIDNAFDEAI